MAYIVKYLLTVCVFNIAVLHPDIIEAQSIHQVFNVARDGRRTSGFHSSRPSNTVSVQTSWPQHRSRSPSRGPARRPNTQNVRSPSSRRRQAQRNSHRSNTVLAPSSIRGLNIVNSIVLGSSSNQPRSGTSSNRIGTSSKHVLRNRVNGRRLTDQRNSNIRSSSRPRALHQRQHRRQRQEWQRPLPSRQPSSRPQRTRPQPRASPTQRRSFGGMSSSIRHSLARLRGGHSNPRGHAPGSSQIPQTGPDFIHLDELLNILQNITTQPTVSRGQNGVRNQNGARNQNGVRNQNRVRNQNGVRFQNGITGTVHNRGIPNIASLTTTRMSPTRSLLQPPVMMHTPNMVGHNQAMTSQANNLGLFGLNTMGINAAIMSQNPTMMPTSKRMLSTPRSMTTTPLKKPTPRTVPKALDFANLLNTGSLGSNSGLSQLLMMSGEPPIGPMSGMNSPLQLAILAMLSKKDKPEIKTPEIKTPEVKSSDIIIPPQRMNTIENTVMQNIFGGNGTSGSSVAAKALRNVNGGQRDAVMTRLISETRSSLNEDAREIMEKMANDKKKKKP